MQHCRRLSTAYCGSAGQRGRYYHIEEMMAQSFSSWIGGCCRFGRRRLGISRWVSGQVDHVCQIRPATFGRTSSPEHSEMSLDVQRRADAGIKSIGWNLDVWTKVGQRPISKFQNDANLGRQLGTFAARSVVGRPRQALRRRVERCSGRKRGPKIQQQDQEMFSCSPVRESWMMNCWWS